MNTRHTGPWLVGALILAVAPLAVYGQQGTPATTASLSARADALHAQALAVEARGELRFNEEAARLYLLEAELREEADVQKGMCLCRAADLLYAVRPDKALPLLVKAAELARDRGDVRMAAKRYIDAAWLLSQRGHATAAELEAARGWIRSARMLATSPLLAQADRDEILLRIDGSDRVAEGGVR